VRVGIIDSSGAEDFFKEKLDSIATHQILGLLGIESRIWYGLDERYFKKALSAARHSDVIHISCHGDVEKDGLILGNGDDVSWEKLVSFFQENKHSPAALVMSACFGGIQGLAGMFQSAKYKPAIIFGSRDDRYPKDYATAWAILYRVLDIMNLDKAKSKIAVDHINAVLQGKFVYRRWDSKKKHYRVYPVK